MDSDVSCAECGYRYPREFTRCAKCDAELGANGNPWEARHRVWLVGLTLAVWWGADWILRQPALPTAPILGDVISRTILGIGIWGLVSVLARRRVQARQAKAFETVRRACAPRNALTPATLTAARTDLETGGIRPADSIAFRRLRWLLFVLTARDQGREGLLEAWRQYADTDWGALETAYEPIRFTTGLCQMCGFFGTIVGMIAALRGFSGTLSAAPGDLSFSAGMSSVVDGLGVAFNTTAVGIGVALPLMALSMRSHKQAQELLLRMDKFFVQVTTTHALAGTAPLAESA